MNEISKNKYDYSLYDGDTLICYKKRDQDPVIIDREKLIQKFLDQLRNPKPDFEKKWHDQLLEICDLRSENRKLIEKSTRLEADLQLKEAMFTDYEKALWYVFDDLMSSLGDVSFHRIDDLFRKAREKRNNPNGTW